MDQLKDAFKEESRFRGGLQILCSKQVDERVFVNTLIAHLMEPNSSLSAYLQKPANKELVIRVRKKFTDIIQS